jgi:hypothetical protein
VTRAEHSPWSSVRAHINRADGLMTVRHVLDRIPHFAELLLITEDRDFADLPLAEGGGRPLGTAEFVTGLERLLGRPHRAPRSRTQTHGRRHPRTTKIAAIGIMEDVKKLISLSFRDFIFDPKCLPTSQRSLIRHPGAIFLTPSSLRILKSTISHLHVDAFRSIAASK